MRFVHVDSTWGVDCDDDANALTAVRATARPYADVAVRAVARDDEDEDEDEDEDDDEAMRERMRSAPSRAAARNDGRRCARRRAR